MKFTIGYIAHNKEVFDKHLGPSIKNLKGDFDIIYTSNKNKPAQNYNEIIDKSKNDWIILTHQDISFSDSLLTDIESTIKFLTDNNVKFSCLGAVGRDFSIERYLVHWSEHNKIYRLETVDCCFIVINKSFGVRFDETNFDDFHLYVEDYCIQSENFGGIYSINTNGFEYNKNLKLPDKYIVHHSHTVNERGCAWGRYYEYKQRLDIKWKRQIKTT